MGTPVKEVMRRAEKADRRKDQWYSLYADCYKYALPQRNLYGGEYDSGIGEGRKKMHEVFDSTAIASTQRFSNRVQSALFPPARNWCRLQAGTEIPPELRSEVELSLDEITNRFFDVLHQTGFDLAISEFLLDLCVGTGVMLVLPGDHETPIRFQAVPQFLVSIEEGAHGAVDNVYRKMRIRADIIERQWPDAKLSTRIERIIETSPEKEVLLLEATIRNDDGIYEYFVIDKKDKVVLVEREMEVSPWIVARYTKVAGEIYGRGPLTTALPDIKTLNLVKELILQNASIAVAGMYTAADDGVINIQNISIKPGAIIPVARNGGPQGESLRPLKSATDFNVAQLVTKDLVASIKKTLLDDTLPPETQSARSATEVAERLKELWQNLGSAFGRLVTECLIPLVIRCLFVLNEQNIIDLPVRVDGRLIKVVPVSPLAQAQEMEDLENILQFVQILGPQGQVAINQDALLQTVARKLGVPQELINTPEEREAVIEGMREAMEPQGGMV